MSNEILETKKKWLYRYKRNRVKIAYLKEKLITLESRMTTARSPSYTGMPRSTNPITINDLLADKQALERRIERFEKQGFEIKLEILEAIDSLENCTQAEILEHWFIDCLSAEEIGEVMGYSARYVFGLYSKALKEIIIPET